MTTTKRNDLTFAQGDDPTLNLTILDANDAPFNLTGKRVVIVIKPKATTPDAQATATLSSAGSGPKIIINTNPATGLATADLSDLIDTPGTFWWRSYVASAADGTLQRQTWAFGELVIQAV